MSTETDRQVAGIEDGTACWEDTLTETDRALLQIRTSQRPVELADEAVAAPDEKRQIVTWLTESGFHAAAEALIEWQGPLPKTLPQRLREAHELVGWLRHYEVFSMGVYGATITAARCTRHTDSDGGLRSEIVLGPAGKSRLMLDEMVDQAAAHEIAEHGDRG